MIAVNRTIYCQQKYHPIPSPHYHRQLFIYCLLRFPNVPDFLYVNIKCPLKLSLPNASIHNITLVAASESQSVQGARVQDTITVSMGHHELALNMMTFHELPR